MDTVSSNAGSDKGHKPIAARQVCFFFLIIVVFFAWFDGLRLFLGVRSTSISALIGLILAVFWLATKIAEASIKGRFFIGYMPWSYRWFIGLFAIFLLFAGIVSIPSVHDAQRFMVHFTSLAGMLILFLIITDSVTSIRQAQILFWTIVMAGMFSALLLLGFALTGEMGRATGLVGGNPNYTANRLLPIAVIVFFLFFLKQISLKARLFVFLGLLIVPMAFLATLSISAILSFVLTLVIGFIIIRKRRDFQRGMLVTFILLGMATAMSYPGVTDRIAGGVEQWLYGVKPQGPVASIGERIEVDMVSLKLIGDSPVTGLGLGQHLPYMADYGLGASHNSHLVVFLELGGCVFLLYVILLLVGLRAYHSNPYVSVIQVGIIAMLLHMFALGDMLPKVLIILLAIKFAFIRVLPADGR